MSFDNRDAIDFSQTDIPKLFRSIFVPTLLGMLFNMAFLITDGIFVGHGVGAYGLASVNLIGPIMMIINGTGMLFGIGAGVVAAIHLAQNNEKAARINVTQAFLGAGAVAAVLCVVLYTIPGTVLHLLGVSARLMASTREYYLWFIPTCLLMIVQTLGLFVIRLDGSPRYAMFSNILPALTNIVLDYVFIFPCHMGLRGAALATDLGVGLGAVMVLYYMVRRANVLKLYHLKATLTGLRLAARNVGYMVKVGLSGFIGELAVSAMMLTGNLLFGHYLGDDGVAAYSVACYLFPIVYMLYTAVAQSAQPIISFNYGASDTHRVHQTLRHSMLIALCAGAAVSLVLLLFAPTIIQAFLSPSEAAYAIAVKGLPLFTLGFMAMAVNICAIGYYQSVERARIATILTLLRGVVLMPLAFLLLPRFVGYLGLWLAVPVAEVITLAIIVIMHFSRTPQARQQS